MVNITINGRHVEVPKGTTILEAAKKLNIKIPTLCHLDLHNIKFVNQSSSCRICVVEVEGKKNLQTACSTTVTEGMNIRTDTRRAVKARRVVLELLLSNHPKDCLVCAKNYDCELQKLSADLGIRGIPFQGEMNDFPIDNSSLSIVRDPNKCILCKRCETMCSNVQSVHALAEIGRGFDTVIGTAFNAPMHESTCTFCGQCLAVCPTGALTETNKISKVWKEINSDKVVVVQTAPAIRVALGEEFGLEPGTQVTGKMVAALRLMGFDKVFDTDFAADLTIMEEASELMHRLEHGGRLPILTSCCPGWVKFFEHNFQDMLDIPSTCKSPHEMFGTLAKTYLAEKMGYDPENVVVVSVMPCVAKKYEAARPELGHGGTKAVDYVVTTRELAIMIKESGIDFVNLPNEDFDNPLGESTGASVIFGATGGVIEAALRTAYEMMTGDNLEQVEFHSLRGMDGIKEATIDIKGEKINIAVCHGLGNARSILEKIRKGEANYHAIEIMACPGGCIGGGGQPYHHGDFSILEKRVQGIYSEDRSKSIRKSHENPMIKKIYEEYLGEPYGEKAHELLHTRYIPRKKM